MTINFCNYSYFPRSDCVLDSTVVSYCKMPHDISNGDKQKAASIILKRGRTILKRRYDPRKQALRNNLFRMTTTSNRDLYKTKPSQIENISIILPRQNGDLPLNNGTIGVSAIKLEDKLISGEEIEYSPPFRIGCRRNADLISEKVGLMNEKLEQRKVSRSESSKSYLKLDKSMYTPTDKSPITAEDYPKLYVTVACTSDKNSMTKSSLLKNIRGIQSADGDSYGINISNSRFFVPKNYIFSGVESSMDDLKFEVDPEMGKLLRRCYSNPQLNTCLSTLVDETDRSSLNITTQCEDSNIKYSKMFPNTSLTNLKSRESDKAEGRQRLFLKKHESKPSCDVIDSLLDETSSKSKMLEVLSDTNCIKHVDGFYDNGCEKDSSEMTYRTHKFVPISKASHDLKTKSIEQTVLQKNSSWIAKHAIIDEHEVIRKLTSDESILCDKICDTFEKSKKTRSLNKTSEINTNSPKSSINAESKEMISSCGRILNTSSLKQELHPSSALLEISSKSTYFPPISTTSPRMLNRALHVGSEKSIKISGSVKHLSTDQEKLNKSLVYNKELQGSRSTNLSETNRANRMKFLRDSLQTGTIENGENSPSDFHIEKATLKISTTNEESKTLRDVARPSGPIYKDQDLPIGRTSSLREKFETIVELRTAPGRRPQIGISCDRKSLIRLVWEPRHCLNYRSKFNPFCPSRLSKSTKSVNHTPIFALLVSTLLYPYCVHIVS